VAGVHGRAADNVDAETVASHWCDEGLGFAAKVGWYALQRVADG